MNAEAPVGIFDSGLGGLTVLKEIRRVLPIEKTVYLGDTARVPYGTRSPETITAYALECARALMDEGGVGGLGGPGGVGVKLLVVACNSASSVALDRIRDAVPVPVLGVIEPGARAAVKATKSGRVGVIGTEATVRMGAYEAAIKSLDAGVEVFSAPCPLFVPLAEEGWVGDEVARITAGRYLGPLREKGVDALVLGCTHYPLLKGVIGRAMGPGVTLIDSAIETAALVKAELGRLGIKNPGPAAPDAKFYVTDSREKFKTLGENILGAPINDIELVVITTEVER